MIYKFLFILVLILHTFVLTKLIFFPYPEFFVNPYLTNQGLKPYSQIMDQHSPGLMFFPVNFDNLGMTTPDAARIWLISIVLITQVMLFFISAKVLKDYKKAFFVSFLYLVWQPFFEGSTFWIDSILPIFFLPAFYTTFKIISDKRNQNTKLTFLTGLFLGSAIVFKQVALPLTIFVGLYLFWINRNSKIILAFITATLAPISLMVLYFASIGVLKDFWYWSVVFNLTIFAKEGRKLAPSIGYYTRVILVFSAFALAFFSKDEQNPTVSKKIIPPIFIFMVGSLAGAISRFDFVHFQPALPFVALGTVVGFEAIFKNKYLKWIIFLYVFISIWWLVIFYKGHVSNEVILYDKATLTTAEKIEQYTSKGEKIFILGGPLHLYQITQTLPAGDIFFIQAPWYFKIAGDKTLKGLIKDNPKIIVLDNYLIFEGYKISDYAQKINKYILDNYHPIDRVGSLQIMTRNSP